MAVFSRSRDRAESFARPYGASGYSDLAAVLKQVDAVVVCTPHPFHAAPAVQALEAGVHVLVERLLASFLQDCDAMIAVATRYWCKLSAVSQRR